MKNKDYKIILDFSNYINDFEPSPNITENEIKEYLIYKENEKINRHKTKR